MDVSDAVIGSVIIVTGSRVFVDTHAGKFTMQPIVSGFLLGSVLLLFGMASPSITKALCGLLIVGAFVTNGSTVLDTAGKLG